MAQPTPDITLLPETTGQEVKEKALESEGGAVEDAGAKFVGDSSSSTPSVAVADPHVEKISSQSSTDAQPNAPPPRPSLAPLVSSQTPTPSSSTPHPKRFSAVNINKKFLEKNTASGSSATLSSPSISKTGIQTSRPSVQPTSSHSRLVAAKLTASPAVSSSTAGWSRPSSVAPSPAVANTPSRTSPVPTAPSTQLANTAAPQLPQVGKVIQPQPRIPGAQLVSLQKEASGAKAVWGNVKPPAGVPILQTNDFPTAAEVANGQFTVSSPQPTSLEVDSGVAVAPRKQTKPEEAKSMAESASKQLRSEEADTFRGVHLDPNAHHWDEMEEDDDNFLDNVIDFGDGRQYTIDNTEQAGKGLQGKPEDEGVLKESPSVPVAKEDRFVDDFDRSWPRSKDSPASATRDFPPATILSTSPNVSPVISHAAHSPQDASRVLFNERSNRLEPYSQTHRPQGAFGGKRSSYHEATGAEPPRGARDGPHNIQVLQKPTGNDFSRGRRFSGSNGGFGPSTSNGYVGGRDNRRDGPPPSPRMTRDQPPHAMDGSFNDRGRRSTMGPPPVPPHAGQRDAARQLPPHLAQVSPRQAPRQLPSRESRIPPESPLSAGLSPSNSARVPPHSPALSHASFSLTSPRNAANVPLPSPVLTSAQVSAPELDEARKGVMHSAAARAKARRQQEEEEREAQKERAHRKAAELEDKMKAIETEKQKQREEDDAKAAKEKEAIAVIEAAVKSVEQPKTAEGSHPDTSKFIKRPPILNMASSSSTSDPIRPGALRRTSTNLPRPPLSATVDSASTQNASWRARAAPAAPSEPLPPLTPKQIQPRLPTSATFVASGPSAAEQVESIADGAQDELEVVDFSDMGKFVGVPDPVEEAVEPVEEPAPAPVILSKASRPAASDFFDDPVAMTETPMSDAKKADFGAWRRKVSQDMPAPSTKQTEEPKRVEEPPADLPKDKPAPDFSMSSDNSTTTKEILSHLDNTQAQGHTVHAPPHTVPPRTPRNQTFSKEATMSSLDDAMSRIKGVLVGMQAHEGPVKDAPSTPVSQATRVAHHGPPQTPSRFVKDRWVPPTMRAPSYDDDSDEPREVFLVTVSEHEISPPTGAAIVRLPSVSHKVEFIHKKLLFAFNKQPYPARMDVLSFDPPVYDMNRKTLSLNEVLFRNSPASFKGKFRYRVVLPRYRGPKVLIPPSSSLKPNGVGAFGRPTVADGASSWRKPVTPTTAKPNPLDEPPATGLSTMSRSPPPESAPEPAVASIPKPSETSPTKSDGSNLSRPRSQRKMPEGSAVAFRRDSRVDVFEADQKPRVNFIVSSELDEVKQPTETPRVVSSPVASKFEQFEYPKHTANGVEATREAESRAFPSAKTDSKSSDDSVERVLITPPSHHVSSSWARTSVNAVGKDSPARAPDPEHLKAVWSQPSTKIGIHPVNSLEGIADDLTGLPFTIQDVKSEDGATPPPSLTAAPSRMSLHDVTRAFQQVPTSSSASTQASSRDRATISPPSTNAPVARPTPAPIGYTYAPTPQNNLRPAYGPYPSPMMTHSPPIIYGHPMASSPVPSRMPVNGQPIYQQSMWMAMPGPPPQPHGNVMRPIPSPYPQMVPYPSPGYVAQHPHPPPPNMMPPTPQSQNGARGRGMPVMSPVMTHAHAHPYAGSPVMMHPPPQNHGYMPMPAGRGQPRPENGHIPSPQHQHPQHSHHPPPTHGGYNPSPASSFVRPW